MRNIKRRNISPRMFMLHTVALIGGVTGFLLSLLMALPATAQPRRLSSFYSEKLG